MKGSIKTVALMHLEEIAMNNYMSPNPRNKTKYCPLIIELTIADRKKAHRITKGPKIKPIPGEPKILIQKERNRRLYDEMKKSVHWTPIPIMKRVGKLVNRNTNTFTNVTICYVKCNYCGELKHRELRRGPKIANHRCDKSYETRYL